MVRATRRNVSRRKRFASKSFLNGKQSLLPMHGTTELGKGLEAAIKRQLGLK
jgi:hypothetical protein